MTSPLTQTEQTQIIDDIHATVRVLVRLLIMAEMAEDYDVTYGSLVKMLHDLRAEKDLNI
jgi:hypothetical protein